MKLKQLTLSHFRNYRELSLSISANRTVFVGKNGQGKTNLLEALYLLSHGKSQRTSDDRQLLLIHPDEPTMERVCSIEATIQPEAYGGSVTKTLAMRWLDPGLAPESAGKVFRTKISVDGTTLKSRSKLIGHFPTVSFFLPDLLLLRGSPSDRRKWLDTAISQYNPLHLEALSQFERIRKQKGSFLKDLPEGAGRQPHIQDMLNILNQQFITAAELVIQHRIQYLKALTPTVVTTIHHFSQEGDWGGTPQNIGLHYQFSGQPDTPIPIETTCEMDWLSTLQTSLEEHAPQEIRRGVCLVGPHRDDLVVSLGQFNAVDFASQGQQRAIVLALKLAELTLLHHVRGEPPVLLLDDVMAELDRERQRFLLDTIGTTAAQVFLTTTHLEDTTLSMLGNKEDLMIYPIHNGSLQFEEKQIHALSSFKFPHLEVAPQ